MDTKKIIPVFFTIDDQYAPYMAVAANSLIMNASPEYQYKLIVLHQGLSDENVLKIGNLARPYADIEFVPMQQCFDSITDHISNRLRADYFTLTIYFRLFIPEMFPQYDKAIYIDSDVVVPGDISQMFNIDLQDKLLGVCLDYSIHDVPELVHYITDGVGVGKDNYFNSGILLMNLKRLREVELSRRFLEIHNRRHFDCIAPDQDYLNALCFGNVLQMDRRWDTMPNPKQPEISDPLLIHYNLFEKPWMYDNIQYAEYFWHYAAGTGYLDWLVNFKQNYSEEQKQSDTESLIRLVARGEMIANTEPNFRTVFNSGEEQRLC